MLGGGGETVLVAVLDVRLRLIDLVTVGQGSPHTVELDVRRVVESVLVRDGVAMILIHNHPSEDPRPSAADKTATGHLAKIAASLGIPLLDHLIVTGDSWYSFREEGALEPSSGGGTG